MINFENLTTEEYESIGIKNKLTELYSISGIPKKYHFSNLEKDWSVCFSPRGSLSGIAKKRSEVVQTIIGDYIKAIPQIVQGNGLKVKFKDSIKFLTDLILDGSKSSGKTFLLSTIAQSAINTGYTVKFIEWSDYVDRFLSFDNRSTNEDFFLDCIDVDFLIFDSVMQYDISNNKFFVLQLDRLISSRLNAGKVTILSIDSKNSSNPVFGTIWNKFTRETFTLKLPEAELKNEIKSKRS